MTTTIRPIDPDQRSTLGTIVTDQLRDHVIHGRFPPGPSSARSASRPASTEAFSPADDDAGNTATSPRCRARVRGRRAAARAAT